MTERTGVSADTLRSWERRHGFPHPHRAGNAYREYTDADVSAIEAFQHARELGRTVPQALREVQASDVEPEQMAGASASPGPERSHGESYIALVNALRAANHPDAATLVKQAVWASSLESVSFEMLLPASRTVADRRLQGELSAAACSMALAWIDRKLQSALDLTALESGSPAVAVVGIKQPVCSVGIAAGVMLSAAGMHVVVANNIDTRDDVSELCAHHAVAGIVCVGSERAIETLQQALEQSASTRHIHCLTTTNDAEPESVRRDVQSLIDHLRHGVILS